MSKRDYYRMDHQIRERISGLFARGFGTSKHKDKAANNGKPMKEKIYVHTTADTYRSALQRFAKAAAEHGGYRNMDQARSFAGDWLKARISEGYSAWTVRLEAAALAKFYGCGMNDFGVELPRRLQKDIKQHRNAASTAGRWSAEKNKDLSDFCLNSGLRVHEVRKVAPSQVVRDKKGRCFIYVKKGKGGKDRKVKCLNDTPYRIAQEAAQRGQSLVFESVPSSLPVHHFRAVYACRLYESLARDPSTLSPRERYSCRGENRGNWFDKHAVLAVTKQLGHNRLDVAVNNYLLQKL